jgi:hypothetical protein
MVRASGNINIALLEYGHYLSFYTLGGPSILLELEDGNTGELLAKHIPES